MVFHLLTYFISGVWCLYMFFASGVLSVCVAYSVVSLLPEI